MFQISSLSKTESNFENWAKDSFQIVKFFEWDKTHFGDK